jgi:hypothetical protein
VAETTIERLLCCVFRRTGKAMEQVLVEDTSRNKCFISRFIYHMFYVLCPFVTCLLTLPRMWNETAVTLFRHSPDVYVETKQP